MREIRTKYLEASKVQIPLDSLFPAPGQRPLSRLHVNGLVEAFKNGVMQRNAEHLYVCRIDNDQYPSKPIDKHYENGVGGTIPEDTKFYVFAGNHRVAAAKKFLTKKEQRWWTADVLRPGECQCILLLLFLT